MKIVIAPDSFKGSLTAKQASNAIFTGLKRVLPNAQYKIIPMADGGEGTMQALVDATNGKMYQATVHNPLNQLVTAKYGILGDHHTAVIEMAQASGLQYVNAKTANPLVTTSYGTGELILHALDHNIDHIIIGLGGSATNDGGAGAVQALGIKLLNSKYKSIGLGNVALKNIKYIDTTNINSKLKKATITLASDVKNPLLGLNGASYVFAKQKGATNDMLKTLDKNLEHFSNIVTSTLNKDFSTVPGSGAAGGLGYGLLAFTKSKIKSGVETVLQATNFSTKVINADFVFTGEGATDYQTKFGKTPYGVALATKKYAPKAKVICLTGNIGKNIQCLYQTIDSIFAIEAGAQSIDTAIEKAKQNLEITAENIGRLIKILQ